MEPETILKPLEVLASEAEEKRKQMEDEFSYDGYKYVRGELFANLREPAVTIRNGNVTFNTACINGLEDVVFVNLLINEDLKRLVVKGCSENDKDALRWCIAKPDKRKSRKMTCPDFTKLVYDMMGWEKGCRYKIMGYRIVVDGETLYVFDLTVHKIFNDSARSRKNSDDGESAEMTTAASTSDRKGFFPDDVANTFGISVEEHREMTKTEESLDGFVFVGAITGKQSAPDQENASARDEKGEITSNNGNAVDKSDGSVNAQKNEG